MGQCLKDLVFIDQANMCVIEATIAALNKRDCFNKLPRFDYRTDKYTEE